MARVQSFLFATWEGGGSVTPALTVVRKLVARGHEVRVMSDLCNRPEAEAAGAAFVPWTRAPSRTDRSREGDLIRDWAADSPPEGLIRVIEGLWAGSALDYAKDLTDELRREPADLVVTSEMLFGVGAACEALGQPFVELAVNVSLFPIPGVPPMGPGLTPARTAEEHAVHAEATAQLAALIDHGLPGLNAARRALGLGPLAHVVDQGERGLARLLATSPAFDFSPPSLPANIRYVGPQLGEPAWAAPLDPALLQGDGPLVAVGFSTTFQNQAQVLQRVADALGGLPVRGVITLGDTIRPDEISPPANVRLVHSAPHDALMRAAAVVVTHGGHGTVTRALTHRRPLLVVPHGRDQNDNAVRVTARGAGLSLPPAATTEELREAIARLLAEPAFADAAARLGAAVAADAAKPTAVETLEALAVPARAPCMA